MKLFENPKIKLLAVLAGMSLIVSILGASLGIGLTVISYGLEKYFDWGLWQNIDNVVTPIISVSMVAGLFAVILLAAIILYLISRALNSSLSNKLHKN